MPTYEYRCPEGHEFEVFQRMSDEPTAPCPSCGKGAERLLSAGAGLLFKGDGFYITDYRSEDYRKAERKEKGDGKKSESAGEASGKESDKPSAETSGKPSAKESGKPSGGASGSASSSGAGSGEASASG